MSKSWSQWLGVDEGSRAEAKQEAAAKKEAKHAHAVEELRALLDTEDGRRCGVQLARGAGGVDRFRAALLRARCAARGWVTPWAVYA